MKTLLTFCILAVTTLSWAQTTPTPKQMKAFAKRAKAMGFTEKNIQFTPNGLMFKQNLDAPGRLAQVNDVIEIQFILRSSRDSILRNTFEEGTPVLTTLQNPRFRGSLEEGLALMSAGDSTTFWINADSMFAKGIGANRPDFIDKGSFLRFDVKMLNTWTMDEYMKARELREMEARQREDRLLIEYMAKNGINAQMIDNTGIFYQQLQVGSGEQPKSGQRVRVHYTGKLINGKVFDSSVSRGEPFEFTVGVGQVIDGWDLGIPTMRVGEKGILLIPSYRGYGERGAGNTIPPGSILIFEVELLNVL